MSNWYGLTVRRFTNSDIHIGIIAYESEDKPQWSKNITDYETTDFLWFNTKNEMETVLKNASFQYYHKHKCIASIPYNSNNTSEFKTNKNEIAKEFEVDKQELHVVAVVNNIEFPENQNHQFTDLNAGFKIGDTVVVRRPAYNDPITGTIKGFSLNQYNIRCADVEIFGRKIEKHPITAISYPEKNYIVTINVKGKVEIPISATSIDLAKEKASKEFESIPLNTIEVTDWSVYKIEDEKDAITYF